MLTLLDIPVWLLAGGIFILRVSDMSLDTLRVLYVMRGRRPLTWVLGFFQSILWVIAITSVLSTLGNLWNLFAYAAGFATGNVVGMMIEEQLAIGHGHMRIMSSRRGSAIAEELRSSGYAATELSGRGKDGMVTVINCSVRRRDVQKLRRQVQEIDPNAFITIQEIRPLNRGFWRA
ncbi:MAG: DUF5698 domain-containing protein [Anaerolineales bacterium]|nr:DUF5698 domain-containing protein [Anaerolineales bacterium]